MNPDRKALNRWAHDYEGYADFDVYLRTGGSILEARNDIRHCIAELKGALAALDSLSIGPTKNPVVNEQARNQPLDFPKTTDEAETPDPENAHPQGDEA